MIDIEVVPFEPRHAALSVDLAQRAFTIVAPDARPKDSPAFLGHIHGEANPAGRAWIAVAREDEHAVASVAAVPARFRTRARTTILGYQIGTFVVDPSVQRQGLGTRVLAEITKVLETVPGTFIYTYPNPRSLPVFERLGYRRVAAIPTVVYLPGLGSLRAKSATSLRDPSGETWDLAFPCEGEAKSWIDSGGALREEPAGFVRDARYFRWRFVGPDSAARYQLVTCTPRRGGAGFALALASHSVHGLRVAILVDVVPNVFPEHRALAIRAAQIAGRRANAWFVYLNTNAAPAPGSPWSVRVPDSRNPRPVQLMLYPENSAISADELAASLAMTADWNGF